MFYENYLGKTDATFTLNFSTGASMVLAQYYNFVRLGREGYTYVMKQMQQNARALAANLRESGRFEVIGEGLEQLPLVAFRLAGEHASYDESDIAWQLSAERGWMVPAYTLPPQRRGGEDHAGAGEGDHEPGAGRTAHPRHRRRLRDARPEGRDPATERAQTKMGTGY